MYIHANLNPLCQHMAAARVSQCLRILDCVLSVDGTESEVMGRHQEEDMNGSKCGSCESASVGAIEGGPQPWQESKRQRQDQTELVSAHQFMNLLDLYTVPTTLLHKFYCSCFFLTNSALLSTRNRQYQGSCQTTHHISPQPML